jgi:hypothetical protein
MKGLLQVTEQLSDDERISLHFCWCLHQKISSLLIVAEKPDGEGISVSFT